MTGELAAGEPEWIARLDPGIAEAVQILRGHDVETFCSCQGGAGHAESLPAIYFRGDDGTGLWVVWILADLGYGVAQLAKQWDFASPAPSGYHWKISLWSGSPVPRPLYVHSWTVPLDVHSAAHSWAVPPDRAAAGDAR